jgi:hypothetical protein
MGADVDVVFTPWPYDAVARGVELLDEKVPGWRERIDPNALDMSDPARCVMGQIPELYGIHFGPRGSYYGFETHHGFETFQWPEGYDALDIAWREAIAGGVE